MKRSAAFIVCALGTLFPALIHAGSVPLAERDWREIASDNFSIKSVLDDEDTIELLRFEHRAGPLTAAAHEVIKNAQELRRLSN